MPPKKKKAVKKTKPVKSKPAKSAKKAMPAKLAKVTPVTKCVCDEAMDGFFYCFKKVQGKWISCRGPFNSIEECKEETNEQCG